MKSLKQYISESSSSNVLELDSEDDYPSAEKALKKAKIDFDVYMSDDILLFDDLKSRKAAAKALTAARIKFKDISDSI